jgi:replicative DNA helicase
MNETLTSPHDLDAEKSALGSVFIKADALNDLADLATDDFFLPAHREIIDAVRAVAKRGRAVDPIVVADELRASGVLGRLEGGQSYLTDLYNGTPTAENARHYAKIIHEKATLRRLLAFGAEVQSAARGEGGDLAALLSDVRRKLAVIDAGARLGDLTHFRDIAEDVLAEIEKREVRFKTTGSVVSGIARFWIDGLDTVMGGIQVGDLGIIAAETSGGKTALAMQAIYGTVLSGGTGMAINLEMPKRQLAERAIVHAARINSHLIRTGQTHGMWDAINEASERLCASKLFIEDDATTLPQICAKARQWRARNPGENALLVIDFAQLIRGAVDKGLSRAQQVGFYGQELKALAKELKIAIILVSQINREGVKKPKGRPSMFDLKESGDLENAADWVVIIHNQSSEPTGDDPVKFYLDKLRNGQKAQREGWWTGRHYLFTDHQPETTHETRFADAD